MRKIPLYRLSEIMEFWTGANQGDYYSGDIEELLIEVSEYDFTDVKDDLITSLKSFMVYEEKLELQNK